MENRFNLSGILRIALKWKKSILMLFFLTLITSVIITDPRITPPYYESTAVIFPSNPSLTDRPYLFKTESGGEISIDLFGSKEDVDRVISMAKSSQVINHIIRKFDLYRHYRIDTADTRYYLSKTISKFKKNYEVFKNEYMAIEIHVQDRDKDFAAGMANEIVEKTDQINKTMILANREKMVAEFSDRIREKRDEVDVMADSLSLLRKRFNIYNPATQGALLSEEVLRAENDLKMLEAQHAVMKKSGSADPVKLERLQGALSGQRDKLTSSRDNLRLFAEGSDRIRVMDNKFNVAMEEFNTLIKVYDQYLVSTSKNLSSIYIMEKAYPAEKAEQTRPLIILTAVLAVLFCTLVTAIITETYRATSG